MTSEPDVNTSTLAETANYIAWKATEPDGEVTYHLELGTVTAALLPRGVEGVHRARPTAAGDV